MLALFPNLSSPLSLKSGLGAFSTLCHFHPPIVLPSTPPSLSLSLSSCDSRGGRFGRALTLITQFFDEPPLPFPVVLLSLSTFQIHLVSLVRVPDLERGQNLPPRGHGRPSEFNLFVLVLLDPEGPNFLTPVKAIS